MTIEGQILQSKVAEVELGKALTDQLFHGFTCDPDAEEKIEKLQTYRHFLEREYHRTSLGGEACLTSLEQQLLFEKINSLSASCDDIDTGVTKDESGLDVWSLHNPRCVPWERYELLAYQFLNDLQMDVKIIKNVCDITADIVSTAVSCDVIMSVSILQNKCDLSYTVDITDKQCEIEFEALMVNRSCDVGMEIFRRVNGCDIDFNYYRRLISCNISPTIITTVFENNSCLTLDDQLEAGGEDPEIILHTHTKSYSLSELKFSNAPNIKALKNRNINLKGSKFMRDPKLFIKNINQDYNG